LSLKICALLSQTFVAEYVVVRYDCIKSSETSVLRCKDLQGRRRFFLIVMRFLGSLSARHARNDGREGRKTEFLKLLFHKLNVFLVSMLSSDAFPLPITFQSIPITAIARNTVKHLMPSLRSPDLVACTDADTRHRNQQMTGAIRVLLSSEIKTTT
jgi:hypothetical protein